MPEPPFLVMVAGYLVDFHQLKTCPHCREDGSCPRLDRSRALLRAYRLKVRTRVLRSQRLTRP